MSATTDFQNFIVDHIGAQTVKTILIDSRRNKRYVCPNCNTVIAEFEASCLRCKTPFRWSL